MVKGKGRGKSNKKQGKKNKKSSSRKGRITANTPYGETGQRLSGFGGLFPLEKFLDLVGFETLCEEKLGGLKRQPRLGVTGMIKVFLELLYVGFQRVGHLKYMREDPLACGMVNVEQLPAISTLWRFLESLGEREEEQLLELLKELRLRVWKLAEYAPKEVRVNLDTTVCTVYGEIERAKKGHNPKHRGKKGLRPLLAFIEETREYLYGKQRVGQTLDREEVAEALRRIRSILPESVKKIMVCGDSEFVGWETVKACHQEGLDFIFSSKGCSLPIQEEDWYEWEEKEYAECQYRAKEWGREERYVVVRQEKKTQEEYLVKEQAYDYRDFVTSLEGQPHEVVAEYDGRADVENQIREAQQEGLQAIASKRFETNSVFFQLVMLAYNLWRWMKLLAASEERKHEKEQQRSWKKTAAIRETVSVTRLKQLYLAAKLSFHANREKIYYSIHESRSSGILKLLKQLDRLRGQPWEWRKTEGAALG